MNKKALVIYGGWDGHEPHKTSEIIVNDLKASGVDVDTSISLDILLDGINLKTFDLIIPNWTMGTLTQQHEANLVAAIESGVGLGGIHGGMGDAFRNSTGYQFITGGQFVAHPDNIKDYTVKIIAKDDTIVKGIPDFTVHSEQYYMHVDPSNEVLATTTFESTSAPWVNGTVTPVIWKRKYGKARVFYFSVGHCAKDIEAEPVREIIKRGLLWAMR